MDLVLWHHKDPRLQSQQQVQEQADKNSSYVSIYRVKENAFIRLADDSVRSVTPAPKGKFAIGFDDREYERMGNLDGRRYRDVYVINMQTGDRKLALKKARYPGQPSVDSTRFFYYEDGSYFVYDMASGQSANITKLVPASFIDTENDTNVVKPPRPALGWTSDSAALLLSRPLTRIARRDGQWSADSESTTRLGDSSQASTCSIAFLKGVGGL